MTGSAAWVPVETMVDAGRGLSRRATLGLLAAGLTGAAGLAVRAGRARPRLRIGMNPWPAYELLFLGTERGLFREAGLEVDIVELGSLGDGRRAFESGEVDALCTTLVEVLMARDACHRDLKVVRALDHSEGADVIVARRDLGSVGALKGRRVGVELASLGIYVLARALERAGLTLADVVITSRDQRAMARALFAGDLDAVVTYPPASLEMTADPRFAPVFSSREIPGEVVDVLAIDAARLEREPSILPALLEGHDRALALLAADRSASLATMAAREGLTPAAFEAALADGIRLLGREDQAALLGPGGRLRAVARTTASYLRATSLLGPEPHLEDCILWA